MVVKRARLPRCVSSTRDASVILHYPILPSLLPTGPNRTTGTFRHSTFAVVATATARSRHPLPMIATKKRVRSLGTTATNFKRQKWPVARPRSSARDPRIVKLLCRNKVLLKRLLCTWTDLVPWFLGLIPYKPEVFHRSQIRKPFVPETCDR